MNSLLHSLCPHAPGDSALYPSVPHSTCSWQVSFYYSLLFEKHENLTVNLEFKKINVLKLFPPWRRLFTTCSGCLMEGFSTSVHINKGIHSEIPPTALMDTQWICSGLKYDKNVPPLWSIHVCSLCKRQVRCVRSAYSSNCDSIGNKWSCLCTFSYVRGLTSV